jgi:hypothetical protein
LFPLWWLYTKAAKPTLVIAYRDPEPTSGVASDVLCDVFTERNQGVVNAGGGTQVEPVIHKLPHADLVSVELQPIVSILCDSEAAKIEEFLKGSPAHKPFVVKDACAEAIGG